MLIQQNVRNDLYKFGWITISADPSLTLTQYASELGKPVPSQRDSGLIDLLKPKTIDQARKTSLSGQYGLGAFPFHTDNAHKRIPPHYVLLRLVGVTDEVSPTLLHDIKNIGLSGSDFARLRRDVWIVNGGLGVFTSTIINSKSTAHTEIVRYDPICMRPAHKNFGKSAEILYGACDRFSPIKIQWHYGLLLIIDNWRILHSRPVLSYLYDEQRILERCLVA